MPIWDIVFFPAKGVRNAPTEKLRAICNAKERSHFREKLGMLQELEHKDWDFKWLKPVLPFYQIREGNFRGYFKLDGNKIVVLHFCRKVADEAKEKDLRIASNNWARYEKG
jgi:mRNA-degrading endonuclease RelE of RelBE toxin-antitoxin system